VPVDHRLALLADEIIRLDARGGRDTEQEPDHDPDAWPTAGVVQIALQVREEAKRTGIAPTGPEDYRIQALPSNDFIPRWSAFVTLAEAQDLALKYEDVEGWHHVQIRDRRGLVIWDRDDHGFAALRRSRPA
jgi:hypothetical protein